MRQTQDLLTEGERDQRNSSCNSDLTPTWAEMKENSRAHRRDSRQKWGGHIFSTKHLMSRYTYCYIPWWRAFERLHFMNLETKGRGKKKKKTTKKKNNKWTSSSHLRRSRLLPFSCNTIYIKAPLIDFQLHWRAAGCGGWSGWGRGAGGYQTLNSIFHSWANHVLFQQ